MALIRCNHLRCEITSLRLADRNKKPISEKDEKKPGSVTPTLFARTGDFVLLVLTLHGGEVILPNDRIALRDNEATLAAGTITVGSAQTSKANFSSDKAQLELKVIFEIFNRKDIPVYGSSS